MQRSSGHIEQNDLPVFSEIMEVADFLWMKGWAERNSGNISVRLTGQIPVPEDISECPEFTLEAAYPGLAGELVYVTGTGCRMRDIRKSPEQNRVIIRINDTGDRYHVVSHGRRELGTLRPTSELSSHLMIHQYLNREKPEKKAVVHTHPNSLIALSHSSTYKQEGVLNRALWGILPETMILVPDGIGVVPYQRTGSVELARASIVALRHHDVLLWEKHGVLAVGSTATEAFDLIDVLGKSADIFLTCLSAGFTPEGLSDEQLDALREHFHLK